MGAMLGGRIAEWWEARCAGRRLLAGCRQRERLLRKLGRLAAGRERHRLTPVAQRRRGEAAYRLYKWDPAGVAPEVQRLCQALLRLESHLSRVARQVGPATARPGGGGEQTAGLARPSPAASR